MPSKKEVIRRTFFHSTFHFFNLSILQFFIFLYLCNQKVKIS